MATCKGTNRLRAPERDRTARRSLCGNGRARRRSIRPPCVRGGNASAAGALRLRAWRGRKMNLVADKFPTRFIEMGVAEQNLASVASGMAAMGKIPFISSYAMFSPGRNWEQIRTTICYNDRPVKIAGSHAGVSVGPDGGTHQAIEDLAITRVIPNMVVISPCDSIEARKATIAMAKT